AADARRADLLARASGRTFWDDPDRAREVMTELAELDDREASRAALERRIEGATDLVRDPRGASGAARAHGVLDEIERALAMLEHRFLIEERGDRADVILTLSRIGASAESSRLLTDLAAIYEAWADSHDVRATRLDAADDAHGAESITLHLDGHGLYGRFRGEAGLHRLDDGSRGKDRRRFAARATVLPCPESPLAGASLARTQRRDRTRFVLAHPSSSLVLEAELPDLRASARDAELERLLGCWLRARIEGTATAPDTVVRRYGVDERFTVDESSGLRLRTKDLASTGLDAIFDARVRARLESFRSTPD
nr:PCRF domain-containing protein [Myxococcota bacterium]